MIVDKIENAHLYGALNERLAKGLKLIQDPSLHEKKDGKYEVDGDNLFYLVQRYTSKNKEETSFEGHREYIDIQAVLSGSEIIGWAPADTIEITQAYKPDVFKGSDPKVYTEIKLGKGTFGVFFPRDGHKPSCICDKKEDVLKVVVKIKV